jgi:hypothetical protein
MKLYTSFLKIMATLLAVPIILSLVIFLGFIGFGIDFNNAWSESSGSSGSMYMLLLPLGFIILIGWAVFSAAKRKSSLNTKRQESEVRHQLYRELELGTNQQEVLINILSNQGGKTAVELSELLGVEYEQVLEIVKELLQSRKIHQDLNQKPPRFFITK